MSTFSMLGSGQQISHYKILRPIGAGGMGEVYLAEDTRLDRRVALKILPTDFAADAERMRRFVQEAKVTSALNHPNIITIYEIGETERKHYIAAEYVEGDTLRQQMEKGSLSLNEALNIALQAAEALTAAHSTGIIHRDIKPENIMLRKDGYVKVLDFGLAKLTEKQGASLDTEAETRPLVQTNPGVVMGTVAYMSPEQARGQETDVRTDIWSLGVVLYEMLAGKVPFTGETVNHTIVSILEKEPLLLENVPDELRRIVRKTLAKDKAMRYQTARDLVIDLKNLRRDLDIQGESERSVVPNSATGSTHENETQVYAPPPVGESEAEPDAEATPNGSAVSGLEYVPIQAKSHKMAALIGIILLGAISAVVYFGFFAKTNLNQIESIAVMPFVNASGNTELEYLSDGLTESLIGSLSLLPALDVRASNSVFRYKGKEVELKKIGRDLSVQAVLTGRVVQRGNELTLYIELVDAATEKVLWKAAYNRQMTNLVSLQNEITQDISNKLRVKLTGADERRLAKNYTDNAEAHQLYLKGLFYRNKFNMKYTETSVGYFQQATVADPSYALAYASLADSYATLALFEGGAPAHEVMPKARDAALKAVALDDGLGEAHAALGFVLLFFDYDFAGADREFKRALELSPNSEVPHQRYSQLLNFLGRHEEALAEIRRALEIDPLSLIANRGYGDRLIDARRFDEAVVQLQKTLELDSNFVLAYSSLAQVYLAQGNFAASVDASAKVYELTGRQEYAALARESFAKGGWEGYLRAMMVRRPDLWSYTRAAFHAALGEQDRAFAELNKAYENRESFLVRLKVDSRFDALRGDPRYQELIKKVGFPP